ncbi:hypothetical protein A4A49_14012 [Nicotiana attenuata]|uniref:DUF4283 domain-containing protein n=1 Tax=Nicotiana attenuata TaxID=49451 RepID=A0A314KZV6_NICAT|nr:hypothetical protein A4A49_14012 [Nicotiana attenuata]
MANQPTELTDGNLSYATKVITSSNVPIPPNRHGRESVVATHTTHNGMLVVLFKASDYYGIMAEECKLTIVGRFLKPRSQIDRIRSKFKELVSIKGSTKIGVFDNYNVFLDFTNEEDFNTVWFKRVIEIEGQQMRLQKWSPDFKPEEDLPIAPNGEAKRNEKENKLDVSENDITKDNAQTSADTEKSQSFHKNAVELENAIQGPSNNIKDRTSRKVKKHKQKKLPKTKAKVIFKPMFNPSEVTNKGKKSNKEITTTL